MVPLHRYAVWMPVETPTWMGVDSLSSMLVVIPLLTQEQLVQLRVLARIKPTSVLIAVAIPTQMRAVTLLISAAWMVVAVLWLIPVDFPLLMRAAIQP